MRHKHRKRNIKKNTKKRNQQRHAEKRFYQRLNIFFSNKKIKRIIQNGKAKFISKRSNRLKVFEVTLEDKTFKVVYDNIRKQIVTCLL
jgi:hypothetical protein